MSILLVPIASIAPVEKVMIITQTNSATQILLAKDKARATDVLLELRYQLSRHVTSIEVKLWHTISHQVILKIS